MSKAEPKIINAKRDANGKVELELYSRKFDVTALVLNGVAHAKLLGEQYEIRIEGELPKTGKVKSTRTKAKVESESE